MELNQLSKLLGLGLSFTLFQTAQCREFMSHMSKPDKPQLERPTPTLRRRASNDYYCTQPTLDPSSETGTAAYIANDFGVPYYVNVLLTSTIPERNGNLDNWYKSLYSDWHQDGWNVTDFSINPECSNVDSPCPVPDISGCSSGGAEEIYWSLVTFANFHSFMKLLRDTFQMALNNPDMDNTVKAIAADFPMQTAGYDPSSLLNTLGSIISVAAASIDLVAPEGELAGGGLGFLGGLVSFATSHVSDSNDGDAVENALDARLASMWTGTVLGTSEFVHDFFLAANLSRFPGWTSIGESTYTIDQMRYLDNGNFFFNQDFNEMELYDAIVAKANASLTAVALTEANWYILKDGYSPDDCPTGDGKSGVVIDNSCYTIETAGTGEASNRETASPEYSSVMGSDDVAKVLGHGVDLKTLYSESYSSQQAFGAYFSGAMSSSWGANTDSSLMNSFAYTMPVLVADYNGSNDVEKSPCNVRLQNETASVAVVGETYYPPNLDAIFTQSFCSTYQGWDITGCRRSDGSVDKRC